MRIWDIYYLDMRRKYGLFRLGCIDTPDLLSLFRTVSFFAALLFRSFPASPLPCCRDLLVPFSQHPHPDSSKNREQYPTMTSRPASTSSHVAVPSKNDVSDRIDEIKLAPSTTQISISPELFEKVRTSHSSPFLSPFSPSPPSLLYWR